MGGRWSGVEVAGVALGRPASAAEAESGADRRRTSQRTFGISDIRARSYPHDLPTAQLLRRRSSTTGRRTINGDLE